MAKPFEPSILTANDLITGDVVHLAAGGRWVRALAEAEIAETPQAAELLDAAGRAAEQTNRVVGPYRIAVAPGPDGPVPVRRRERIRCLGPTIRPDLGPQAEGRPSRFDAA
ncbi:MAG: DUF2849 domain-containing protein [Alphaproteobacteria bacterium]|jgi:hypothetical protein|nr:DUF2849 domain-containing protein [Alphaproteobacteria bacterium]